MSNGWHKLDDFEETRQIRVTDPRPPQVVITKSEPKLEPKPFPWYLITGLVLGFLLGLLYAWWVNPVVYSNTEPATLRADFKDNYRLTIAQAYAASGDLDRAESRLALLRDDDAIFILGSQAQQALAAGFSEDARALALLASALQDESGLLTPTEAP
ncbi:MAG: hypothetical protein H0S79_23730 [Anaerolineaceae bacterium]|nr:hypothetical protein [Anaerolineaceae bacterium]